MASLRYLTNIMVIISYEFVFKVSKKLNSYVINPVCALRKAHDVCYKYTLAKINIQKKYTEQFYKDIFD